MANRGKSLKRRGWKIPKEKPPLVKPEKKKAKRPKKIVAVITPTPTPEIEETIIEVAHSSRLKNYRKSKLVDMKIASKLTTDEWQLLEDTYIKSIDHIGYDQLGKMFDIQKQAITHHFRKLEISLPAEREKFQAKHSPAEIRMMSAELEKIYTKHNIKITLSSLIQYVKEGGNLQEIAKEMKMVDIDKLIRLWKFVNNEPDKIIEHRVIGAVKPTPEEIEDADYEVLEVIE